jgi:hypothetical protein
LVRRRWRVESRKALRIDWVRSGDVCSSSSSRKIRPVRREEAVLARLLTLFIREGAESGLWGDEITPNIMAWG